MKLISLLFLFSPVAFAAQSAVYCKSEGEIYNAGSEDGRYECAGALMLGEACFTGSRKDIIQLINVDGFFNWDEEWLEKAHFKGKDSIAYLYVDGVNETQKNLSMDRCTKAFFRR